MFLFHLKQLFRALGLFVFLALLVRGLIAEPGRVNGQSMEPTFYDGNLFLINKYVLLLRLPQRGDIVQARDPLTNRLVIKRVIGLPKEQLAIHDGTVWLRSPDGTEQAMKEPWLAHNEWSDPATGSSVVYLPVPEQSYFLLGDNRDHSGDSRVYGSVHRSDIYGLVMKPPF